MADNFGVLGSASGMIAGQNYTAYTCPVNKAAKFKLMGSFQGSAGSVVAIFVGSIKIAEVTIATVNHWTFTNAGAGLLRAPAAAIPNGQTAAETVQPGPPIYYLSTGGVVLYGVTGANLLFANLSVVGVEIDLTL